MEVLPCSIHENMGDKFDLGHCDWRENVGHCNACYQRAMFRAMNAGNYITWGDVESYRDQYRESLKTPEEKAAEMVVKEKAAKEMTVKAHLCHMKLAFVSRKGALKRVPVPCKYFCHGGVFGAPTPGGGTWVEGCEAHLKGLCPAYHPDEPEWAEMVAAAKAKKSGAWRR
jgi:hypothetical protein